MRIRKDRGKGRSRRGTAAVELAVCLLPLMTIVMGILETGRLMMVQEQLINSAREGARLGVLGGSTMGTSTSTGPYEVNYRVRQSLAGAQIPTSAATIAIVDLDDSTITDLTQSTAGDRIQVTISVPFRQVAWAAPWFFGNATLTGASVMRKEAP